MRWCWRGNLENNKLVPLNILEPLVKMHKIIPITWACPVFPLANFTVVLVGTNIEKCDMQFVTEKLSPPYL